MMARQLAGEFQEFELRAILRDSIVPPHIHNAIVAYVCHRRKPGHFLQAVIKNDLRKAVNLADETNLRYLRDIVGFFYNHTPGTCNGSPKAMEKWLEEEFLPVEPKLDGTDGDEGSSTEEY